MAMARAHTHSPPLPDPDPSTSTPRSQTTATTMQNSQVFHDLVPSPDYSGFGRFDCLVPGCGKKYKSSGGIRYHFRQRPHGQLRHSRESLKQEQEMNRTEKAAAQRQKEEEQLRVAKGLPAHMKRMRRARHLPQKQQQDRSTATGSASPSQSFHSPLQSPLSRTPSLTQLSKSMLYTTRSAPGSGTGSHSDILQSQQPQSRGSLDARMFPTSSIQAKTVDDGIPVQVPSTLTQEAVLCQLQQLQAIQALSKPQAQQPQHQHHPQMSQANPLFGTAFQGTVEMEQLLLSMLLQQQQQQQQKPQVPAASVSDYIVQAVDGPGYQDVPQHKTTRFSGSEYGDTMDFEEPGIDCDAIVGDDEADGAGYIDVVPGVSSLPGIEEIERDEAASATKKGGLVEQAGGAVQVLESVEMHQVTMATINVPTPTKSQAQTGASTDAADVSDSMPVKARRRSRQLPPSPKASPRASPQHSRSTTPQPAPEGETEAHAQAQAEVDGETVAQQPVQGASSATPSTTEMPDTTSTTESEGEGDDAPPPPPLSSSRSFHASPTTGSPAGSLPDLSTAHHRFSPVTDAAAAQRFSPLAQRAMLSNNLSGSAPSLDKHASSPLVRRSEKSTIGTKMQAELDALEGEMDTELNRLVPTQTHKPKRKKRPSANSTSTSATAASTATATATSSK
eukprot:m.251885 g.251885  ORF g.251885 m.251885 type:complete len:674 (+) comp15463_c0_seq1:843-2864(+)